LDACVFLSFPQIPITNFNLAPHLVSFLGIHQTIVGTNVSI
jgi:hypothetical protein